MRSAIVIIVAYLLGSIPFGYLIVRSTQGADVRETGSGGTGATNVSRRAGKLAGVVTLVLDALKGATAVVVASWVLNVPLWHLYYLPRLEFFASSSVKLQAAYWSMAGVAVAVILGHMFPPWLGFRGGKGVATAIGVFLLLAPTSVALAGLLFVFVVLISRYVSLGSIVAATALPFLIWLGDFVFPGSDFLPLVSAATTVALLIVFAHRANIGRLLAGTESRFR